MSSGYKVGDLVWAKMKRFAPWPARIVQPTSSTPKNKKGEKKEYQWVYFFGSRNYGWIESENCLPYLQYKEEMVNSCKTPLFRKAVEQIEEFISKQNVDPSFDLELPPEKTQREKEDSDEKFNKLISPKKPKKVVPMKRQYSESERSTASKRSRPSTSRMSSPREENGIGDITSELFNNAGLSLGGSPIFDSNNVSELFNDTEIPTSNLTFGFIGVGNIGGGVVSNLISAQHKVNLYSRTLDKCEKIMNEHKAGLVKTFITPCDIMQNSDVVFTCVTDSRAAKDIVSGNCGILGGEGDCLDGKGYVEMTGLDPETSKDNCEIIKSKGGRYLEAMVQGSKNEADKGNLVVLVAGDRSLFVDCQSCFKAMGKTAFFLGEVGYASKTNLILQLMKGVALVGLAEGLSLADRCGISSKDVLNIFQLTNLACPYLTEKADMIVKKDFKNVQQAIEHMQKDLKLALDLSDQLKQPLLVTSTANEVYKHGRRLGYDGHDTSCIYMRTRH